MLTLDALAVLALKLPHIAELPHNELKPLALKLPHIAELPHHPRPPSLASTGSGSYNFQLARIVGCVIRWVLAHFFFWAKVGDFGRVNTD